MTRFLPYIPGQVNQLQHELTKKDELLRIVASASEEGEQDSCVSTPQHQPQLLGGGTAAAALSQLEHLQNKLQDLEEENQALKSEVRRPQGGRFLEESRKFRWSHFTQHLCVAICITQTII